MSWDYYHDFDLLKTIKTPYGMSKTAEGDPVYCEKDNLFPVLVNCNCITIMFNGH